MKGVFVESTFLLPMGGRERRWADKRGGQGETWEQERQLRRTIENGPYTRHRTNGMMLTINEHQHQH